MTKSFVRGYEGEEEEPMPPPLYSFTDGAMPLADELVNAARNDLLLRQHVLVPQAREALREYLERGPSDEQQSLKRVTAWNAGFKEGARASIPEGWQLVPQEPTPAMVNAPFVGKVEDQSMEGQRDRRARMADNWRAMVKAAPSLGEDAT